MRKHHSRIQFWFVRDAAERISVNFGEIAVHICILRERVRRSRAWTLRFGVNTTPALWSPSWLRMTKGRCIGLCNTAAARLARRVQRAVWEGRLGVDATQLTVDLIIT